MKNDQKGVFELFSGDKSFVVLKYKRIYDKDKKQLRDFLVYI